ncbi:MAG TPA: hypothetical protein VGJ73_00845 [Verrucomicrobiae bacterium]
MRRIIITSLCLALLAVSWQRARGFALLGTPTVTGTGDAWQTPVIGYNLPGDIGTPKDFNQAYRRNLPIMYYGCDPNFATWFGPQGEQSLDAAFNILNNTFTNNGAAGLDGYSTNLVEFPFDSQSINYTAEALGLTDLKSTVLYEMMEQMGLAEPERYVWTLHTRFLPPGGTCPFDELYQVIQRNYYYTPSPLDQVLYSPYVNDTLYTYIIEEACTGPDPLALAAPVNVDPFKNVDTAVAGLGAGLGIEAITATNSLGEVVWEAPFAGGYYTALTRDDVGGLRYMMSTNNIEREDTPPGVFLESTNFNLQPLTTSPLGPLLQFAQTNPPTAVLAAFPSVTIDTVSTNYTVVTNPVVVSYFTNVVGQPVDEGTIFVVRTNGYTVSFQTNYVYTFANMVIFNYSSNTPAQIQTIQLLPVYGQPLGTVFTNVSTQSIILNEPSGQYFLIPSNSCGYDIVITNALNVFAGTYTNATIGLATNVGIIDTGFVGSEQIVENLTNSLLQFYACTLVTNGPDYYRGIGTCQFIRVSDEDIDPTLGTLRSPITNTYAMYKWNPTNSQTTKEYFYRVLTQPDFLFSGTDLTAPNVGLAFGYATFARNVNFDTDTEFPGAAGPGTINPPSTITLNLTGDLFGNGSLAEEFTSTNTFLSQLTQGGLMAWASYDGTTNTPIVYPNGTSLQDLENELVVNISPSTLPDGTNNAAYPTVNFSATGGQPPYSWSYSGNLPQGLSFFNGTLSGTPVNNSITPGQNFASFDFNIILTDSFNRVVSLPYTINIYPAH